MSLLRRVLAKGRGRAVGTDRFGNAYFESYKPVPVYGRHRRWVVYAGEPDPTTVPPEWHGWLHHITAEPLPEDKRHPWQKEHRPNMTGTPEAYRPPGHDSKAGRPRVIAGEYEAWTPDQRDG